MSSDSNRRRNHAPTARAADGKKGGRPKKAAARGTPGEQFLLERVRDLYEQAKGAADAFVQVPQWTTPPTLAERVGVVRGRLDDESAFLLRLSMQKRRGRTVDEKAVVEASVRGIQSCWRWYLKDERPPGDPAAKDVESALRWMEELKAELVRIEQRAEPTPPAPAPTAAPAAAAPPVIWRHAGRSYSTDGATPRIVPPEVHNFLMAFLDRNEAADTAELKKYGVSNPTDVANKTDRRFGAGVVRRPAVKGEGYFVRVLTLKAAADPN
jgi:hypothetical protein